MAAPVTVARASWLGYRWSRHGLDGGSPEQVLDDLLLLGLQDSRLGGAAQALVQRTPTIGTTTVSKAISPHGPLVGMWSVRGAPHAHRLAQLGVVRDALAVHEGDDGGAEELAAVQAVSSALRDVVTAPTTVSAASTEVAALVRPSLVSWCERCGAAHVPDALFRAAGRQARIVLGRDEQRATVLYPPPQGRQCSVDRPRAQLLNAYLRANGPTTRTVFRDWMAAGTRSVAALWSGLGPLVRVQVDGRRLDLPEDLLDGVTRAPPPQGVVLVPPHDPYLRQVDRTLLVRDARRRGVVWRALSAPGALLVDAEVAGTWRYRRAVRTVSIAPFHGMSAGRRAAAEASAALMASATGDVPPRIVWQ